MQKNKRNYQKELENVLKEIETGTAVPTLFLHSCCAPCSSYCLEYLSQYFEITVFYYNPNIFPESEYEERIREQERLIERMNARREERMCHPIHFQRGDYQPELFFEIAKGLEHEPEGGARCTECFKLRLAEAAKLAKEGGYDFVTTTLTISPLKDAERLNTIGEAMAEQYGVRFLNSDFKKKNGYRRSVELSKEYELYRQDYCGCVYSKRMRSESTSS